MSICVCHVSFLTHAPGSFTDLFISCSITLHMDSDLKSRNFPLTVVDLCWTL